MISRSTETYAGQACIRLENDSLSLWATTSVGPRILGLALRGGENLFAELPEVTLECPGVGAYHFYGGHRLWSAPEDPPRTYLPDDLPVEVQEIEAGICLIQPIQQETHILKQMIVKIPDPGLQVIVEHVLQNQGEEPIELAPWAITQMKIGGEAILPLAAPDADPFGVLPNRKLALWPYSDLGSANVRMGKHLLRIQANMDSGKLKLGFPNPSGWLAYLLGDTLLVKHAPYQNDAYYFDEGSSSECYCDERFLELESLGPRVVLQPGEKTTHVETWRLMRGIALPDEETRCLQVLEQAGLSLAGAEG
jgi:hypothetical protein